MGTNCAPLIADLFLFCYERDFMLHLSPDSQLNVIEAFNNTSRYLDDILNMNNDFFDRMVHEIYPKELTLTKSSLEPTHATFLDLDIHLFEGKCVTKHMIRGMILILTSSVFRILTGIFLNDQHMEFIHHN